MESTGRQVGIGRTAMREIVADDGEIIRVAVEGSGPPIVFVHEWASRHQIWERIVARLAPSFHVLRWDARGHAGHPRRSRTPLSVARLADDLAFVIDRFRLDRPVIVAHSMGALVLWEMIARHGCEALGSIVVIDMTPKTITDADWRLGVYGDWSCERDAAFVQAMREDFAEAVVRFVSFSRNDEARRRFESGHPSIDRLRRSLAQLDSEPLIELWQNIMAGDWRPVLPTITVPALLVYGSKSHFYSLGTGIFVRDAIPRARLEVYEGADHYPHLADPDRFAADLIAFAAV
jgi:pimeloyl-ACP methyl ester carboxylesterase